MRREDVENGILITFLDINDNNENIKDVYKLDTSIFTTPFRTRVSERINSIEDNAYGFLAYEIESKCESNNNKYDFIEMSKQKSFGLKFSKKYHDKLIENDRLDDLC